MNESISEPQLSRNNSVVINKPINDNYVSTLAINHKKKPTNIGLSKNGTLTKRLSQKYSKLSLDEVNGIPCDISNFTIDNSLKPRQLSVSLIPLKSNDSNSYLSSNDDDSGSEFSVEIQKNNSLASCINEDNCLVYDAASSTFISTDANNSNSNEMISQEIVMEGWIYRKRQLQTYKKYYLVAKRRKSKAGILCFYRSEHDQKSKPFGTIDLSECTDIILSTPGTLSKKFEFKLFLRKQDLYFATNSLEVTEKWIESIKELIPKVSKNAYETLQQEVNSLHATENALKGENMRLTELINDYKISMKN